MKFLIAAAIAFAFPMASAGTVLGASDPESEARELFVEAAKIAHSGPCAGEAIAGLFANKSNLAKGFYQLFPNWMDRLKLDSSLDCLEHLKSAIHLQQRILGEFPQTEVAFYLAANGYVTVEEIDGLIAQTRQQISLFESLLASFEDADREAPELEVATPEAQAAETPVQQTVITKLSDQPLSLSVRNAIRRQVEKNWSLPVGAEDAGDLEVEIAIVLMPDGVVQTATIVDFARLSLPGEEFFRSMAESALRAVQRASPLQDLPPEKYEQWRKITFTFVPPV